MTTTDIEEPLNQSKASLSDSDAVAVAGKSTALLSGKARVVALVVLIVAGLAYFAIYTFNEATVEYMRIDDVAVLSVSGESSTIGVLGKLVPDSYIKSADGITASFRLKDEDGVKELPVVYSGEIGQVFFNNHSEIILNGSLGGDGVFQAEMLSVRCPSKYLTEQERMELEGGGDPPPYQPDYSDAASSSVPDA